MKCSAIKSYGIKCSVIKHSGIKYSYMKCSGDNCSGIKLSWTKCSFIKCSGTECYRDQKFGTGSRTTNYSTVHTYLAINVNRPGVALYGAWHLTGLALNRVEETVAALHVGQHTVVALPIRPTVLCNHHRHLTI
jgi:hypothetical protein